MWLQVIKVLMGFAIWSFQNGNQFYGSSSCCSHDAAQKQRRPHVLKLRYGQAAYAWSLKHDGDNTLCSGNTIAKSWFEFLAMTCTRTRVQICLFGAKNCQLLQSAFLPLCLFAHRHPARPGVSLLYNESWQVEEREEEEEESPPLINFALSCF